MIIGTAGHIDHGKTSLVKALTGVDTDRLPEEKRRGITVELGFAPFDLDGMPASIIDVPGHEAFVKTMVAGSAGVNVGLLVVAADEGMMPQTREHLSVLQILGVPALVVALTKKDLVDAEWCALVEDEVRSALGETPWASAPLVACSSKSSEGIAQLRSALASAMRDVPAQSANDIFRLPVDRCFTVKGTGTVVTGTVWSGSIAVGAEVRILPQGISARVRRIQRHGATVEHAFPGDRAAIALAGVEVADVPRGSNLVTADDWEATSALDACISITCEAAPRISHSSKLTLHLAGADADASLLTGDGDSSSGQTFARIRLDRPITARGGDRFVLRLPAPVGTIGGGIVLDPFPGAARFREAERSYVELLSTEVRRRGSHTSDPALRFHAMLLRARIGVPLKSIPVRVGVSPDKAAELASLPGCITFDGTCFPESAVNAAMNAVLEALTKSESTFPLDPGVQLESVSALARTPTELTRAALAALEQKGAVVTSGAIVARKGWTPSLDADREKTVESLVHAICSSGSEPPTMAELSRKFGSEVPGLLRYLERNGRLIQVAADRYYARDEVNALIEKLRTNLEAGTEYGPSQLRDVLGFSRKYLIPFLEYCDRAGITERKGDGRALRSAPASLTQM